MHDDYGHQYSVLTDWKNLKINGRVVFNESKTFSYQKGGDTQISVKKDEFVHIEAEFRRHRFTIHDFTFLRHENLWYLITGNLLTFFLIYQLLSYFIKHRAIFRLCDYFFLVTFFPILFFPMVDISDGMISVRENRELAVKPKLKEMLEGNLNTGGGYEKWFNDHFGGRTALIKLHDILRNKLSHIIRTEKAIYFKENGWEFHLPLVSGWGHNTNFMPLVVQNLLQLDLFCRQNRIKLYVLEVPKKESVYKELIKGKYGFDEKMLTKVSQAQEFIRVEARKHRIPYVYPYEALHEAAKKDFVFFKWSHHWTDWGAFVGYYELMKEVCKDFPDVPVVSLDDYQQSQNWLIRDQFPEHYDRASQLSDFFDMTIPSRKTLYKYYDHKNGDNMALQVGKFTKDFSYPRGKRRIMLIGTSQNENLNHFLPYSAAQTKYIRANGGQAKRSNAFKIIKLYKKDILGFKPDILILSISTDNLFRLRSLCATK